jgi:hypothetical protein
VQAIPTSRTLALVQRTNDVSSFILAADIACVHALRFLQAAPTSLTPALVQRATCCVLLQLGC